MKKEQSSKQDETIEKKKYFPYTGVKPTDKIFSVLIVNESHDYLRPSTSFSNSSPQKTINFVAWGNTLMPSMQFYGQHGLDVWKVILVRKAYKANRHAKFGDQIQFIGRFEKIGKGKDAPSAIFGVAVEYPEVFLEAPPVTQLTKKRRRKRL